MPEKNYQRPIQPNVPSFGPNVTKSLKSCNLDSKQFSDLISGIRVSRKSFNEIIKGPTTQHLYWDIVLFVAENYLMSREVSISDIYSIGGKSKSTVVSAIKKLEKSKLLEINGNSTDKRRKNVQLNDLVLSKIILEFDSYALDVMKIVDRS